MKVERWFHRCTDIKCRLCLSKMWTAFGPFWPFLIGCMVSADYWLADYPELRRATKPSTIGGPLGEPGFCIFCSTAWQWSSHSVTLSHHNIHSHIPIKFYQFNAQSVHLSHIQFQQYLCIPYFSSSSLSACVCHKRAAKTAFTASVTSGPPMFWTVQCSRHLKRSNMIRLRFPFTLLIMTTYHWFRKWFVSYSEPSHYLYPRCLILICTASEIKIHILSINTLRPRQDGCRFPNDIFEHIFLNENVIILIKISLKFVPIGPINNIPTLVQIMAWCLVGTEPLSEPMMVRLYICVTRP